MNKITVGIILVVMAAIMNGCATFKSSVDNKLEKEFNEVKRGPKGAPFKSITTFSESLVCMDNLMQAKGIRDIPVMIEDIEDKTDSVKVGVRDMLISAISEMTVNSHGLKLIIYGKDTANLISYMKAANKTSIYETQPLYDIQGSITQYDKGISSIDGSLGLFYRRKGGLGGASSSSLNVVALDLNVLHTQDMSIVPGVSSRNAVSIFQRGDSLDSDATINKLGIYFDINLSRNEGQAQAIRNLVELAAIETVGKLVKVPYESCIAN